MALIIIMGVQLLLELNAEHIQNTSPTWAIIGFWENPLNLTSVFICTGSSHICCTDTVVQLQFSYVSVVLIYVTLVVQLQFSYIVLIYVALVVQLHISYAAMV